MKTLFFYSKHCRVTCIYSSVTHSCILMVVDPLSRQDFIQCLRLNVVTPIQRIYFFNVQFIPIFLDYTVTLPRNTSLKPRPLSGGTVDWFQYFYIEKLPVKMKITMKRGKNLSQHQPGWAQGRGRAQGTSYEAETAHTFVSTCM